jgi:hypothetical protein
MSEEKRAKLAALADPRRNPNTHERFGDSLGAKLLRKREVAARKLAEADAQEIRRKDAARKRRESRVRPNDRPPSPSREQSHAERIADHEQGVRLGRSWASTDSVVDRRRFARLIVECPQVTASAICAICGDPKVHRALARQSDAFYLGFARGVSEGRAPRAPGRAQTAKSSIG